MLHFMELIYLGTFGLLECLVMLLTLILEITFEQRNFSNKAIDITNSVKPFQNSIDATMTGYQNLIRDSNLFLNNAYWNLNFMMTVCIRLEQMLIGIIFLIHLGK